MMNSRAISDLKPGLQVKVGKHILLCKQAGIDIIITCTLRDNEAQAALYAKGRENPPIGKIVTNAKPGESAHQYGVAYDVAILEYGKLVWDDTPHGIALWNKVGELGEKAGLEWAGRWKSFREMAHFQDLGGKTIQQLKGAHG